VGNHLKNIFDFYIKSSIHVALSVTSLAFISMKVTTEKFSYLLLIFIFSSAFFAYNFVKFQSVFRTTNRTNFPHLIFWLTFECGLLSIYLFFRLTLLGQLFVLFGGVLVLLYSVPFAKNKENLRNAKGWKIYLVVLTWVFLTVGLPLAMTPNFNVYLFLQLSLIQGVYIFVAIMPFEIRDLAIDPSSLSTLPQRLGIYRVKVLGWVLLSVALLFTFYFFGLTAPFTYSTIFSFGLLAYFLARSSTNQTTYFSSFWVESIPIFWAVGLYFIN
jgi:hypothetical protein